ncbi:hypothetical protein M231_07209 [Tremella mesenterica]|uniref:PWI domain-containing protein n=1 Tax=Tremella mesenterica TaxID=5217 RepID=A0A4V1M339_TREME|nr:hypothetical protein M231_07209 [Tremella mesenterica]
MVPSTPMPGYRPPPSAIPPRPIHPGIGLPPLPSGLPAPVQQMSSPSTNSLPPPSSIPGFTKEVKTTSVFVGSIAPGITDETLKELLNACGPLHELKRVVGATGKPQAFGFASFESPEVVMRCLRCLNGVELPDMSPEGRQQGKPPKALLVKVDEKTREFLDEFEATLGRSDDDEAEDAISRKAISHIVALLTDPNAVRPEGLPEPAGNKSPLNVVVPAHLQDLKEGDLPEEQRVAVLDQIAIFRENAARREREKKRLEEEKERFKAVQPREGPTGPRGPAAQQQPGPSAYGYGNRGLQKEVQARAQAEAQVRQREQSVSQSHNGPGPNQNGHGQGFDRKDSKDPQGYQDPVAFVKPQSAQGKDVSDRTDEEEEEIRRKRRKQEADALMRDRERQVESRERLRVERYNREMGQRRQYTDTVERMRRRLQGIYDNWDDDERGARDDVFYVDRQRWRLQRQSARLREYQEDVRDRNVEADEMAALEKESEEFLKKQMEEFASMEQDKRNAGLLSEDAAPIRLALNRVPMPEPKEEKPKVVSRPVPQSVFGEGDEEEQAVRKKQRTLVKLEYDGAEDTGLTEAEQAAKRTARLLEIRERLPHERRRLFGFEVEWAALTETLLQGKILNLVKEKMRHFLGEVDDDLVDFVLEHLRARKGPNSLIEGIEPVFAEEAPPFVHDLWRQIIFESAAYVAGVESGTMQV